MGERLILITDPAQIEPGHRVRHNETGVDRWVNEHVPLFSDTFDARTVVRLVSAKGATVGVTYPEVLANGHWSLVEEEETERPAEPTPGEKLVDLMAALEESVREAKASRARKRAGSPAETGEDDT